MSDLPDKIKQAMTSVEYWQEVAELSDAELRKTLTRLAKLEAVAQAAKSVLSEEGVKEYLSAWVMGVELIERVKDLDGAES